MTPRRPSRPKDFHKEKRFHACAKPLFLLQAQTETAIAPFRGREVFEFTSLFERWFLSTDPQAGDFLLRLDAGSSSTRDCGVGGLEPQDTGLDKTEEFKKLEKRA
jgi:hypothetical protein